MAGESQELHKAVTYGRKSTGGGGCGMWGRGKGQGKDNCIQAKNGRVVGEGQEWLKSGHGVESH